MSEIITALIYLIVIGVSTLIIYAAEKKVDKNKVDFFILSCAAILIPCLFAGLRGLNVGVDVQTYSFPLYKSALSSNNFSSFFEKNSTEIGFGILVYVSSKITKSIVGVHFTIALVQILPVYIYAYKKRKSFLMHNSMLIYFCLFYFVGFNIMRECCAAGLILLAYSCYTEHKYIRTLLLAIIASMFHSSAVIGVIYCICGIFISSIKKKNRRRFYICLTALVIFGAFFFLNYFIDSWSRFILLINSRYIYYINSFFYGSGRYDYMFRIGRAGKSEIFYKIICFVIPLFFYRKMQRDLYRSKDILASRYVCMIAVFVYMAFLIVFKTAYGYRLSLYGEYFFIPYISSVFNIRKSSSLSKVALSEMVMKVVLLSYVVIAFSFFGAHGVSPFEFYN